MEEELQEWRDKSSQIWIEFCRYVETKGGPTGEFISRNFLKRIVVNAPVLLGFVILCTIEKIITSFIYSDFNKILGVDDKFTEWWNPFSYLSFLTHVIAHGDWDHLKGNMVHLLLVGPAVEHEFGSRNFFLIIISVAISSAFVHLMVGKERTYQLGASGVVFAAILLSSLVTASHGTIPLSFIIVATWWVGDEIINFFFAGDAVSHHAHISGGIVGTIAGYYIHRQRANKKTKNIVNKWLSGIKKKTKAKGK